LKDSHRRRVQICWWKFTLVEPS